MDVDATIYCEKASHKGIIIGKQGAMLKKISTLARQDIEKFMGTKGIPGDLGEGQGKLAGQCELRAKLRLPGRVRTPEKGNLCPPVFRRVSVRRMRGVQAVRKAEPLAWTDFAWPCR